MDYYDGNTVTALWNYAQHYAMSDNNWDTTFGPSTPGALNLISGQTGGGLRGQPDHAASPRCRTRARVSTAEQRRPRHVYGDPDPAYDDCSDGSHAATLPARRLDR